MAQTNRIGATHEQRENVVVQDLTGWDGADTEGMDTVESEWSSVASRAHITAAVTEFSAEMQLGADTQNHLAKEWSANAAAVGIDRIAFVSEGIKARAVSANLDVPQEIKTFKSRVEAVEWAKGA